MTSAETRIRGGATKLEPNERAALDGGSVPRVISVALAVVATTAAGFSFFFASLLTGVEVGNGNLRGTALAILVVGVPVLVTAMICTARGSARGLVVWLGTVGYLLYQAVLFCFATPLNNMFLIYVAYLGLALWSLVLLLRATDLRGFATRISPKLPNRFVAGFSLTMVALNAFAWLAPTIPAVLSSEPTTMLEGTGLLTNPVIVQDLAIWLPLLTVAAMACWRHEPWGVLVTGAMLSMFVLESVTIATDQWFGSSADPTSDVASMSMVPVFVVLAVVTAVPLVWYLRKIDRAR